MFLEDGEPAPGLAGGAAFGVQRHGGGLTFLLVLIGQLCHLLFKATDTFLGGSPRSELVTWELVNEPSTGRWAILEQTLGRASA